MNEKLSFLGLVINLFKTGTKNSTEISAAASSRFPVIAEIKNRVVVESSVVNALAVCEMDPYGDVTIAFDKIANHITRKVGRENA